MEDELKSMIESVVKAQLENYRKSMVPSSNEEGGMNNMACKYREKVKVGFRCNGEPVFVWASGNTKEELHRSIADILNRDQKQTLVSKEHPIGALWEDVANQWFDTFHRPKLRPKTLAKDQSLFKKHVLPAFEHRDIASITPVEVQNYLKTKQYYTHVVVQDMMFMMRAIFNNALEDDLIRKNPMNSSRIVNPSIRKPQIRKALLPEEQADIINHIPDLEDVRERRLMALLMFTCMRPCEIYGLKWEDFDLEARTAYIRRNKVFVDGMPIVGDTKTEGSKRPVHLDDQLLRFLAPIEKEGFVIDGVTSESVIRHVWRRIKKQIDVHGMTPYVGRHTFATNMRRAGVPLRTAISIMGHSDERMLLRRYIHVEDQDIADAASKMSSYFGSMASSVVQSDGM